MRFCAPNKARGFWAELLMAECGSQQPGASMPTAMSMPPQRTLDQVPTAKQGLPLSLIGDSVTLIAKAGVV
ncbi:hypothetical protein BN970_03552 [Mycolicibacterium conceptionense]|uniref:Uncharacterized protein n=1 Tax=Mycolicibacterium conceptionense TaxID=451644 RepID=A0A0U1DKJ6_9MYCO|nr:hypothetical protein AWB98_20670 [Mycolicibacterium conceptionense]CQD16642.1 hypothetical protein BN970_03552 [Mycolicibacterium conceptionense]